MAVHFNRIASSWKVEGALALVELDQDFPLDVMDVSPLDYLFGVAEARISRKTILRTYTATASGDVPLVYVLHDRVRCRLRANFEVRPTLIGILLWIAL